MLSLSATEALVVGAETLNQLKNLSDTNVYREIMDRLQMDEEYLQGVILELMRLADISIEGDIWRARLLEGEYGS